MQNVHSQIPNAQDRLERIERSGRTLRESCRDPEEQVRLERTIDSIRQELSQLRSVLEERRHQTDEAVDAWHRFHALYDQVLSWLAEKKPFLAQPLSLTGLAQAKHRLAEYNVSIRYLLDFLKIFCGQSIIDRIKILFHLDITQSFFLSRFTESGIFQKF